MTSKYQQKELDDNLIENNHEDSFDPPKIQLMISGETTAILQSKTNPSISSVK